MFCTQCGTAFETQWRFCRQCGYELAGNVSPEAAQLAKAEADWAAAAEAAQRARNAASPVSVLPTPPPSSDITQPGPASTSPANSKQANLVLARHLVGAGALLLVNPAVWKSSALLGVLGAWVGHYLPTVAIAGVLTGALTLFGLSTPWRTTFGILVWIVAVLSLVGAFIGRV